jgi:hypothetical protein
MIVKPILAQLAASLMVCMLSLQLTSSVYARNFNATRSGRKDGSGIVDRCGMPFLPSEKMQTMETNFNNKITNMKLSSNVMRTSGNDDRFPITVPVYFHVITKGTGLDNGDLPESTVSEQIEVLNQSYQGIFYFELIEVRTLDSMKLRRDFALFFVCVIILPTNKRPDPLSS